MGLPDKPGVTAKTSNLFSPITAESWNEFVETGFAHPHDIEVQKAVLDKVPRRLNIF